MVLRGEKRVITDAARERSRFYRKRYFGISLSLSPVFARGVCAAGLKPRAVDGVAHNS